MKKNLQARSISLLGKVDLYIGGNEHAMDIYCTLVLG
jgi:hypothetical protein